MSLDKLDLLRDKIRRYGCEELLIIRESKNGYEMEDERGYVRSSDTFKEFERMVTETLQVFYMRPGGWVIRF